MPSSMEPTPRTTMTHIGAWKLGRTLGRGAYAHVRLATHESGRQAACKILPALHQGQPYGYHAHLDAIEAHKELVLLKGLAGAGVPGVVGLEGVITHQGWNFIFLSLYDSVASSDTFKWPESAQLVPFFRRVCLYVDTLHRLGISHEDIKRSNVLVALPQMEPALADFGFAHLVQEGEKVSSLGGTADYSAREKVLGGAYDPMPSDVWSLGVMLLKMLGRAHPYPCVRDGEQDWKERLRSGEAKWPFSKEERQWGGIGHLIRRMMQYDPQERYTIDKVLAHPFLRPNTDAPDPAPFRMPSLLGARLTPTIMLDVAFLAFVKGRFALCQSLAVVEEWIILGSEEWVARWAGMLGLWKQREETLWEDVSVRSPVLARRDNSRASRKSLRPLREIKLSPLADKTNTPVPAPFSPVRPRTRAQASAAAMRRKADQAVQPPQPVTPRIRSRVAYSPPRVRPRHVMAGETQHAQIFKGVYARPVTLLQNAVGGVQMEVAGMGGTKESKHPRAVAPRSSLTSVLRRTDALDLGVRAPMQRPRAVGGDGVCYEATSHYQATGFGGGDGAWEDVEEQDQADMAQLDVGKEPETDGAGANADLVDGTDFEFAMPTPTHVTIRQPSRHREPGEGRARAESSKVAPRLPTIEHRMHEQGVDVPNSIREHAGRPARAAGVFGGSDDVPLPSQLGTDKLLPPVPATNAEYDVSARAPKVMRAATRRRLLERPAAPSIKVPPPSTLGAILRGGATGQTLAAASAPFGHGQAIRPPRPPVAGVHAGSQTLKEAIEASAQKQKQNTGRAELLMTRSIRPPSVSRVFTNKENKPPTGQTGTIADGSQSTTTQAQRGTRAYAQTQPQPAVRRSTRLQ